MTQKQLVVVGIILFMVLVVLMIITAIIGSYNAPKKKDNAVVDNYIKRNGPTRSTDPAYYTDPKVKQEIIDRIQNRSEDLSRDNKQRFDDAKTKVPFETKDYEVDYLPAVDQIVVSKKTSNAVDEAQKWIEENELDEVDKELDEAVIYTDLPLNEYEFLTDKFQDDPVNLPDQSIPGGENTIDEAKPSSEQTKDVQLLSDLLKTLLTFDLGGGGGGGTFSSVPGNLMTDSLDSPVAPSAESQKAYILSACAANAPVYQQAEAATGVGWPVIAAIHYREGSCRSNSSVVSGEILGTRNPDGNGTFTNLLDSAIYAANFLKSKAGGAVPTSLPDLAHALGNYNGTGNKNCGRSPYTNCPPRFDNDDHNYAMALFDSAHEQMYIIYCANGVRCNPPRPEKRPGATTVIRLLMGK